MQTGISSVVGVDRAPEDGQRTSEHCAELRAWAVDFAANIGRVTWDSPEVEYLNVYLYGDENQTFKNRLQEGYREGFMQWSGRGWVPMLGMISYVSLGVWSMDRVHR